ncbi:hypothetical protein IEQ34_019685 [Dendrobium chrysotoxum]|uniref:glutathione transferase n=1 Tax=Dendrobium chrysotoxum TaxID=161865 RepID=A0AAV7G7I8_DENCH|nr:hypothetical protein IEQ34_019685 [Dendrobium chrysotoxum]
MASVQVFGSPASAEVARVLTCLFEKEVEFQLIRTDTYKGKNRRPDYLKLQIFSSISKTLNRMLMFPPLQPSGESLTYEDGKNTLVGKQSKTNN